MSQFNDRYLHSIDAKGRLQLSREIRGRLKLKKGDRLHLIPSLDNPPFLEVRTEAQWRQYRERFMKEAPGDRKRDFVRFIQLMSEVVVADAQGRIGIPKRLREQCGLDGDVAVVDMETYIEVWHRDHMHQKYADMVRAFNEINRNLY